MRGTEGCLYQPSTLKGRLIRRTEVHTDTAGRRLARLMFRLVVHADATGGRHYARLLRTNAASGRHQARLLLRLEIHINGASVRHCARLLVQLDVGVGIHSATNIPGVFALSSFE